MKSIILIVVALGALTLLYSCNRSKKCQTKEADTNKSVSDNTDEQDKQASIMSSVLNDVYGVVKVYEKEITPETGMTMELHLKEGKINGNGGCNNYFGKLALDGEVLSITENRATKMACPNLSLEQELFSAMRKVNGYQAKSGVLFLTIDGEIAIEARRMD